jgi:hypothetical protein
VLNAREKKHDFSTLKILSVRAKIKAGTHKALSIGFHDSI